MDRTRQKLEAEIARLRARIAELEALVQKLQATNDQLRATNQKLQQALEEAQRAGKRQAAPFRKADEPKANPKKPGRGTGKAARAAPAPGKTSENR